MRPAVRRMLASMERRSATHPILSAVISAAACLATAGAAAESPPSIIFILADDLGWGDLGCYGQSHFSTPGIDRLAAEGIRFTACYSGTTVCAPSRCSLMTGLHTGHALVRGNANDGAGIPLRPGDVTVAEVLRRAGYATSGWRTRRPS